MLNFALIGKVFTLISNIGVTAGNFWKALPMEWRNVTSATVRKWLTNMQHSIPDPMIKAVSAWSTTYRQVIDNK